jgi:hypothetical protein
MTTTDERLQAIEDKIDGLAQALAYLIDAMADEIPEDLPCMTLDGVPITNPVTHEPTL